MNLMKKILFGMGIFTILNNQGIKAQNNYSHNYNTIAHEALQIEDSVKNIYPSYKTLDELIAESKKYIPKKDNYTIEEKKTILKNIYNHITIKIPEIKNKEDICYRMSMIYLGIGEANNLPLHAVETETLSGGHVFIRWDEDEKHNSLIENAPENKGDINFETTTGEISSDKYYILENVLSKKTIENNFYLSSLTKKQFKSLIYGQRSQLRKENKLKDLEIAISLNPKSPYNYILKAKEESKIGEYEKAIKDYTKAINMNDEDPLAYVYRAFTYSKMEKHKKSIEDYTKAIDKMKGFLPSAPANLNLRIIIATYLKMRSIEYIKIGNYDLSSKNIDEAVKILESVEIPKN